MVWELQEMGPKFLLDNLIFNCQVIFHSLRFIMNMLLYAKFHNLTLLISQMNLLFVNQATLKNFMRLLSILNYFKF